LTPGSAARHYFTGMVFFEPALCYNESCSYGEIQDENIFLFCNETEPKPVLSEDGEKRRKKRVIV